MTRIIAGLAAGCKLQTPKEGTRPSSDRLKESLFSALEARRIIENAHVLDLYAGSGALGLEALSREAATLTLIENQQKAAQTIKRNLQTISAYLPASITSTVKIQCAKVNTILQKPLQTHPYTLVFIDPPYNIPEQQLALTLTLTTPHINPDATVIVERAKKNGPPPWPKQLQETRNQTIGESRIWWATPKQ